MCSECRPVDVALAYLHAFTIDSSAVHEVQVNGFRSEQFHGFGERQTQEVRGQDGVVLPVHQAAAPEGRNMHIKLPASITRPTTEPRTRSSQRDKHPARDLKSTGRTNLSRRPTAAPRRGGY